MNLLRESEAGESREQRVAPLRNALPNSGRALVGCEPYRWIALVGRRRL
jgi:hypothetical protein